MNTCLDCHEPIPASQRRCGRCLAIRIAGDREDAATIEARYLAAAARRRYESRLQANREDIDPWAQRAGSRAPMVLLP